MRLAAALPTFLLLLVLAGTTAADSVVLTNGRTMNGTIVKETDTAVVLELNGVGKMTIEKTRIREIRRSGAPSPAPRRSSPRPGSGRSADAPLSWPSQPAPAATNGAARPVLTEYRNGLPSKEEVSTQYVWDFVHRLEKLGYEATEDLSHDARHAQDWRIRMLAVRALGKIGDPAGIPALVHALGDSFVGHIDLMGFDHAEGHAIQGEAEKALRGIGGEAMKCLWRIADDRKHGDQALAVRGLRRLDAPQRVPLMTRLAEDRTQRLAVRREAVEGLAGQEEGAPETLVGLLGDMAVQEQAFEALKATRDRAAIEPLMEHVRRAGRNAEVARRAAEVILATSRSWRPTTTNDRVDFLLLAHSADTVRRELGQTGVARLKHWAATSSGPMRSAATRALSCYQTSAPKPVVPTRRTPRPSTGSG